MNDKNVQVGVGVIIQNSNGAVLVGKRINSHAPFWSIPGGSLELGETFEQAAIREIKEETNLIIHEPHVIAVTNNLETFQEYGKHYVSVILTTQRYDGELKIMEPHKCELWQWTNPLKLPMPHFDASRYGVSCFLSKKFYQKN